MFGSHYPHQLNQKKLKNYANNFIKILLQNRKAKNIYQLRQKDKKIKNTVQKIKMIRKEKDKNLSTPPNNRYKNQLK